MQNRFAWFGNCVKLISIFRQANVEATPKNINQMISYWSSYVLSELYCISPQQHVSWTTKLFLRKWEVGLNIQQFC